MLATLSFLSGCSAHSVDRTPVIETTLAPVPAALRTVPPGPGKLPPPQPKGCDPQDPGCGLPARIAFPILLADRHNLATCTTRMTALVDAVDARDRIQGAK
jgi:hypothetical protein